MPPEEANVFSHDLPPTESNRPAWEWVLAWLLLPLFLLDVAVRRLASWLAFSVAVEVVILVVMLFGMDMRYAPWWGILGTFLLAEVVGWAIRFRHIGPLFDWLTHTVTALGHTGQRSAEALGHLKSTRDRVRKGLKEETDLGTRVVDEEPPTLSAKIAKRRYDAGDAAIDQPTGDLQDALGGAKASEEIPSARRSGKRKPEAAEDESTTSRLLRSKKRKRDE